MQPQQVTSRLRGQQCVQRGRQLKLFLDECQALHKPCHLEAVQRPAPAKAEAALTQARLALALAGTQIQWQQAWHAHDHTGTGRPDLIQHSDQMSIRLACFSSP